MQRENDAHAHGQHQEEDKFAEGGFLPYLHEELERSAEGGIDVRLPFAGFRVVVFINKTGGDAAQQHHQRSEVDDPVPAVHGAEVLAEKFNPARGEDYRGKYELSAPGRDELFDSGLMTMRVLREVDPDTDVILGVGLAPLTVTDKKVEEDTPFNLADVVTEEPTDEEIVPVEEIDEPAPGYDEEIGEETAVAEAQPAAEEIAEESEPAQEVAQAQNAIDEKPVKHSAIKPVKVVVTNEDNYRYRKRSKPRGAKREIIDTGTLNANFWDGETVDVEKLIEKGLFPATATYYKVLRGGEVTKPLIIRANDFSGEAEEAIISAGGKAVRI